MNPVTLATIVYTSALFPLLVMILLSYLKKLPIWIWKVYIITFVICALGWELWYTYGLIDGQSVNERRSEALNSLLPQNINWIINSLADAGIGTNGLLYVWLLSQDKKEIFKTWLWKEFLILAVFFLVQNIIVEMYIYQAQLAQGFKLSWAPLAFTANWYNPVLFTLQDRTVHLQAQLPWIIMTPLFYWYTIKIRNKEAILPTTKIF